MLDNPQYVADTLARAGEASGCQPLRTRCGFKSTPANERELVNPLRARPPVRNEECPGRVQDAFWTLSCVLDTLAS